MWKEFVQGLFSPCRQRLRIGHAECHCTGMAHKNIGGEHVVEPRARGAQTEVLFHTVIAAQRPPVERSDSSYALSAQINARTASERNGDRCPEVGAPEQAVE